MNVVLISIDDLRFDCVGYQKDKSFLAHYGVLDLIKTPTLDNISKQSYCFPNGFSPTTYTTTAHASLFTGFYPPKHQVRGFMDIKKGKLANNLMTLAEIFQINNYNTAMLSDVSDFFSPLNLDRGFEKVFHLNEEKLFRFIENRKNNKKNFFIFAHFFDVHFPFMYSPNKRYNQDYYLALKKTYQAFGEKWPEKKQDGLDLWNHFWTKDNRANVYHLLPWYVRGISKFDQGRLKDFLKKLFQLLPKKNTLLVIVSDHGEGKSNPDSDYFDHANSLYDSVIRVPIIIQPPLSKKQRLINDLVSLIDIFPTILNLVFKDQKKAILPQYSTDGLCLFNQQALTKRNWLYAEVSQSNKPGRLSLQEGDWFLKERAIRTKNFKYLVYGQPERLFEKSFYQQKDGLFLKELYQILFYRFINDIDLKNNLKKLKTKKISKIDLVKQLLNSQKHQERKNFVYFDLNLDPNEEIPLDPLITKDQHYPQFLKKILKIDNRDQEKIKLRFFPFHQIFEE